MEETGFERTHGLWRQIETRTRPRHQVGIPVDWRPPKADGTLSRSDPHLDDDVRRAILHDLSVSGARLLLPAEEHVTRDSLLQIRIDGEWTAVQVVWTLPSPHPSACWCGVLFVKPSGRFMATIFDVLGIAGGGNEALTT